MAKRTSKTQNGRRKNGNGVRKNGHTNSHDIQNVIPPAGLKPMLAAQEMMSQSMPRVAAGLGKSENELTSYDVMMFTYTNLPKVIGHAMLEASFASFESWQSMLRPFSQRAPFGLGK